MTIRFGCRFCEFHSAALLDLIAHLWASHGWRWEKR